MNNNRRDFLKLSGLLGTGLLTGSSFSGPNASSAMAAQQSGQTFNMCGYAAKPVDTVRIGFIGLGNRGGAAVPRINHIDGVDIRGLCDIRPQMAEAAKEKLKDSGHRPLLYTGKKDAWKSLCENPDIDLVYIATPWELHTPIAVYALNHGKHVAVEVPAAKTVEECWQLVEASEKNRRHCVILENCCYDFFELLTLNMARQGFFGELVHGEGAYIHDISNSFFNKDARYDFWRLKENAHRNGNLYPTHGLGPVAQAMNINRGDRMDYLVSVCSNDFTLAALAAGAAASDPDFKPFAGSHFRGNMNISTIKTVNGKTILLQHDVSSPHPYSRIHALTGTKAAAQKYPLPGRIATSHEGWLEEKDLKELEDKYTLPVVKLLGEMAKNIGGHGGMDFLMDWRLIDCLRNGLPVDHDVYDAAAWSVIGPLSEASVAKRGASVDVPDFTRGSWQQNKPLEINITQGHLTGVK